jgi:hypothetical protein
MRPPGILAGRATPRVHDVAVLRLVGVTLRPPLGRSARGHAIGRALPTGRTRCLNATGLVGLLPAIAVRTVIRAWARDGGFVRARGPLCGGVLVGLSGGIWPCCRRIGILALAGPLGLTAAVGALL